MKKFSGLSKNRKRGKKTAHAMDRMRGPKWKIYGKLKKLGQGTTHKWAENT